MMNGKFAYYKFCGKYKLPIPIEEFEKEEGEKEEVWYVEEETEAEAGSTTWILLKQSMCCSSFLLSEWRHVFI